ncbi:hypothetical protein [Archangium sp.]|uniref:hypothetical protein n=1 Tax=Archangium sp. TaxID=1872627 RepID=UPI002D600A16|nr:hypothetical protein [Archangium sp.]HYO54643.1 hypothetical protein [Archangium sp.]
MGEEAPGRGVGSVGGDRHVLFDRQDVTRWESSTVDPVQVLTAPRNRLDLRDNAELKRIDAPKWMGDIVEQV